MSTFITQVSQFSYYHTVSAGNQEVLSNHWKRKDPNFGSFFSVTRWRPLLGGGIETPMLNMIATRLPMLANKSLNRLTVSRRLHAIEHSRSEASARISIFSTGPD